jgi:hypothetical protein
MTHPIDEVFTDDFIEAHLLPPDHHSEDPYSASDFDGRQDIFSDSDLAEGLGGDNFPLSQLAIHDSINRLRDLIESDATTLWDGQPIRGRCLSAQRQAPIIPALHYSAWQDWILNPDKHPCTFDDVDWESIPTGAFGYNKSGPGGSGYGHIWKWLRIFKKMPICITNDAIPGKLSIVNPLWFRQHWGQEMVGWSRVCNGFWQKGISGNGDDEKQPPQKPTGFPQLDDIARAFGGIHALAWAKHEDLDAWVKGHPNMKAVQDAEATLEELLPLVKKVRATLLGVGKD